MRSIPILAAICAALLCVPIADAQTVTVVEVHPPRVGLFARASDHRDLRVAHRQANRDHRRGVLVMIQPATPAPAEKIAYPQNVPKK